MRYFLRFAYDGTAFHGSQRQPNGITVQETMEQALAMIFREEIPLTFAGRTDAGVHAREMYAHFDLEAYPKSFPEGKDFDTEEKLPSLQGRGWDRHFTLLPCGVNIPEPWSELQTQQVEQLTLNQWVQRKLDKDAEYVLFAGAFDNAVKDPELAKSVIAVCNSTFANRQIELIELKGYSRNQVTALMYNCHALLMTSKTEGSPQVVKEAMACGCPIVSVDVGDVAERTSGVEGCYVVPTREPKDIAEALQEALAFGRRTNGRERIIEMGLSNEQVSKRLEIIYENVLAKRK